MTKRKAISKKVRFDVFKRDAFTCQYCGAHPPEVILHVDHIHPVFEGGTNEESNLITSCAPCNLGKGARMLTAIPLSLSEKSAQIKEAEAQIKGYQALVEQQRDRIEEEMWRVANSLKPGSSEKGYRKDWLSSITMFIKKLGLHVVLDAAEIANGRFGYSEKKCFMYF